MSVKTLLVGLGGTGCEIAARVKRKIIELNKQEDPNVQIIGFDTDGEWEGTEGLDVIYTSRQMTVRQYLSDMKGSWEEWFPNEPGLMQKSMTKGAGQIRLLSRLAFAETISSNRLGILRTALLKLQTNTGVNETSPLRVMIISSFAGGTGSGMFIQAALFLRAYIKKQFSREDVIVRGLFAMPDLYMEKNPSPGQKESMYANAYAALRELNAINIATQARRGSDCRIRMKIDRLFDSEKDLGDTSKRPFDFVFFVDNTDARGRVMTTLEDYKNLMTTATYMQVYSPVTAAGDSREDNAILTVIINNGKPLYGGVGASKIVYPYQEILEYCGKRATVDSVSRLWTHIDKQFEKANAANEQQRKTDPGISRLVRRDHYIDSVNGMLKEGTGNAAFGFLREALSRKDDKGMPVDPAEQFFSELCAYANGLVTDDADITSADNQTGVKHENLKGNLYQGVVANETALTNFLKVINERVALLKASAVQSIFPDDLSSVKNPEAPYLITNLLKTTGGSIYHPLAVRLLLYRVRKKIDELLKQTSDEVSNKIRLINNYFKDEYDNKSTEEVETAEKRAQEKGLLKQSRFSREYIQKSTDQKERLEIYAKEKMLAEVLKDVLKRLDCLIGQFERLFDNLDGIIGQMKEEIETFETKQHTSDTDDSVYLLCSPEKKKAMFNRLNFVCTDSNDNPVYDEIYKTLYESAYREYAHKNYGSLFFEFDKDGEDEEPKRMDQLFRDTILKRNTDELKRTCSDKIDLDVFDALQLATGGSGDALKSLIEKVSEKAKPYLTCSAARQIQGLFAGGNDDEGDAAYTLTFWGIHPEVMKKLNGISGNHADKLFTDRETGFQPEIVVHKEYSRYEISCYEALYCVTLPEIPKFLETGSAGVFYENYSKRLDKMRRGKVDVCNPHIDIHWHKRSCLPYISNAKNEEDDARTRRAMWLALIYGGLPTETVNRRKYYFASFATVTGKNAKVVEHYPPQEIRYNGNKIWERNVYELFKALQEDEVVTNRLLEVYGKVFEDEKDIGTTERVEFSGPRARRFAVGLIHDKNHGPAEYNALNLALQFLSHQRATDNEKREFVDSLKDLIKEYCKNLGEGKDIDLRSRIYKASALASGNAGQGYERYITLDEWKI